MRLSKIMFMFFLALPISIGLRLLQIYFTIDSKTGFYLPNTGNQGQIILILILLCALFVALFARLVYKKPDKTPKINIYLFVSAIFLGGSILIETLFQNMFSSVVIWQSLLLRLAGFAAAAYFIVFSLKKMYNFKLPEITAAIPAFYLIIRMIFDFTSISKLALISDNIILIITYCVILLFFLNFAKLHNGMDTEKCFKNILTCGLVSSLLCFTNSIPNIIINIISAGGYLHTSIFTNISVLLFGVFILTFTLSYFSKSNT